MTKSKDSKVKYPEHRNKEPKHRVVRHYVKSYINHCSNMMNYEDIMYPKFSSDTYTWSDCKPYKSKVFRFSY
jgi:hypothetical protein